MKRVVRSRFDEPIAALMMTQCPPVDARRFVAKNVVNPSCTYMCTRRTMSLLALRNRRDASRTWRRASADDDNEIEFDAMTLKASNAHNNEV